MIQLIMILAHTVVIKVSSKTYVVKIIVFQ